MYFSVHTSCPDSDKHHLPAQHEPVGLSGERFCVTAPEPAQAQPTAEGKAFCDMLFQRD